MTAFVEELLVEVLIGAQGCPEPMVERHLRSAMVDFYRDSCAWRFTTESVAVIQGSREVELELPADTTVRRLYWAKLDDKPLRAVPVRSLRNEDGTPTGYAIDGVSRTLLLDKKPTESYILNGLVANVAILPLLTLDELPDELFMQHRDGIVFGALSKLLAMPNVSWGNLQDAQVYAQMAEAVKRVARREAESLQAPVARKVRYGGIQ